MAVFLRPGASASEPEVVQEMPSASKSLCQASSTLPRVPKEKFLHGSHQLEVSFGGELDLHKHFNACVKNPGHLDFVPAKFINRRHIEQHAKAIRGNSVTEMLTFCRFAAQLTVRLKVGYVSPHRSNIEEYPLSDCAGQRILSVGSGCVTDISLGDTRNSYPCPVQNCRKSKDPHHDVFGYITITTAAHVVFDNDEAVNTTVDFYDDDPVDKESVETGQAVAVESVSVEEDFCKLRCVTHSKNLYDRIKSCLSPLLDDGCLSDVIDSNDVVDLYEQIPPLGHNSIGSESIITDSNDALDGQMPPFGHNNIGSDSEVTGSNDVLEEQMSPLGHNSIGSDEDLYLNCNFIAPDMYSIRSPQVLVIHISHPHGQSKQVSFGTLVTSSTEDNYYKHIYTVPTCNGSSGGPVWIIPVRGNGSLIYDEIYGVSHGGCHDSVKRLNHSCSGTFYPAPWWKRVREQP